MTPLELDDRTVKRIGKKMPGEKTENWIEIEKRSSAEKA
jgi:hypothetical protein